MKRSESSDLVGDACLSLADELSTQPQLFDSETLPCEFETLRGAKVFVRTGKIAGREGARAMAVALCKLTGLSDRETARKTGVCATSVPGIMRALEASGRLPTVHQRLTQGLIELAESSTSEMQRIIKDADGAWSPNSASAMRSLSVAMGIAVDKHQLLTGQSTAIIEQRVGPTADAVAEWEGKLKRAFAIDIVVSSDPPDPQSGVNLRKALPLKDEASWDTPQATPKSCELQPAIASPGALGAGGGSAAAPPPTRATLSSE